MSAGFAVGVPAPPMAWLAVVGDTHCTLPPIEPQNYFAKVCAWIAANIASQNIAAVLHRGDFAYGWAQTEFDMVNASWPIAGIPNIWAPGNHDGDSPNRDYTRYDLGTNLGVAKFGGSWVGGYPGGSARNSVHAVSIGGRTWGVLALEFNPPDATVAWADTILATFNTWPFIVVTHSDLHYDGTLTDNTKLPAQDYVYSGYVGGDNYGQQLWDKSFHARGNVALVLSGHEIPNRSAYLATTRPSGAMFTTCHHVLRNYQTHTIYSIGNPYITLIGFDYANNRFHFQEYSPPSLMDEYQVRDQMSVQMY